MIALGISAMLFSLHSARAASGEESGEISGTDTEKPKNEKPYSLQAADPDAPKDPAVVAAKKAAEADAALKKGEKKDEGPPIYQKWQFWALAGAVVIGVVGAIIGGVAIAHSINGGDVAQCPKDYAGCFGEGR